MNIFNVVAATIAVLAVGLIVYFIKRSRRSAPLEVRGVYLTANRSMLDVRYRVKNSDRMRPTNGEVYIVSADGKRIGEVARVMKIGRLCAHRMDGKVPGYLLMRNAVNVKRGDKVSVIVGSNRQDDLVVL